MTKVFCDWCGFLIEGAPNVLVMCEEQPLKGTYVVSDPRMA